MDSRIPNGYNIEHGGSKVEKIADETKALLSVKSKGNKRRLGSKHTDATKKLMSTQRQNMSAQTRQRLSAARKTWSYSEESKAKMSVSQKGRIASEETKAKIREARKLQVFSEETKQKLSDAAKRQWARQKGVA
jgi:hypothetical protein